MTRQKTTGTVSRRSFVAASAAASALAAAGASTVAFAQGAPIKIGLSISQTGPLGAGGKAALDRKSVV